MDSGKVFLGLLSGLAAGAVLGILFAPDKGEKTRKKIMDQSDGYADDWNEKFHSFMDGISEKVDQIKSAVGSATENGHAKKEEFVKEVVSAPKNI